MINSKEILESEFNLTSYLLNLASKCRANSIDSFMISWYVGAEGVLFSQGNQL